MTPGRQRITLCLVIASACGCLADSAESPVPLEATSVSPMAREAGAEAARAPADSNERDALLGPFLAEFWRLPIPAQGATPAGWSEAEAALDPTVCGACHPVQYAEWSSSFHAGAYSPGFSGQLFEGSLSRPGKLRFCQTCHAPLAEQQPVLASGEPEPDFDPKLRAQGIVCASCHVRAHQHIGPTRRPELPAKAKTLPHGGFVESTAFEEARFCATCHQFFDEVGPAGKPMQNTFVEWRDSPQASQGRTCQSCHMPDRAHTWRGIHDPEMVRGAIDVELVSADLSGDRLEAALVLTNRDVGHAFPTYVTPRVFLAIWQSDASGAELADTRVEMTIGREIDFSKRPPQERFDTRVMPGASVELDYSDPRHPEAAFLHAEAVVDPGHHYRGVYQSLLRSLEDPRARDQISLALRREGETSYVLAVERRALPALAGLRHRVGQ